MGFWFRAFTTERELLPRTLAAGDALEPKARDKALAHLEQQRARKPEQERGRVPGPHHGQGHERELEQPAK